MADLAIIRSVLPEPGSLEAIVARSQYQRPSIIPRNGYWEIRPYVPKMIPQTGKFERVQTRIKLGECKTMTKTQAAKEADRIMQTINEGRFFAAAQLDFGAIVEKYIAAEVPNKGAGTREKYLSILRTHIIPAFGHMRIADIDIPAVKIWMNGLRANGIADATVSTIRNVLSAVFTAAKEWNYFSGPNPVQAAKMGKIEPKRTKRLLTMDETQKFFAAIPDTKIATAETARLVAMTAVITGLRVSEILGLQWGDIDLLKETLSVSRRARRGDVAGPKTAAGSRVVQIGRLAAEFAKIKPTTPKPTAWVFHRDGAALDDRDLQQYHFRPAAELAGIYVEGFGLHWLRAQNITLRQQAGATLVEAAKAAGHKTLAMTVHYTQTDPTREQAHVEGIFERIDPKGAVN